MVYSELSIAYASFGGHHGPRIDHFGGETLSIVIQRDFVRDGAVVIPANLTALLGDPAPEEREKTLVLHVRVATASGGDQLHEVRFHDGVGGRWAPPVEGIVVGPGETSASVDACDWDAMSEDGPKPVMGDATELLRTHQYRAGGPIEVVHAWYGFESGPHSAAAKPHGGPVKAIVQHRFLDESGCVLVVPGDLNTHFGDPLFGTLKMLAVHVRDSTTNEEAHLRFHEGIGGRWQFSDGPRSCHRYNFQPKWRVAAASYGTADRRSSVGLHKVAATAIVQAHIGGDDVLRLRPNFNALFGDPTPGKVKFLEVQLTSANGTARTLRFAEGSQVRWDGADTDVDTPNEVVTKKPTNDSFGCAFVAAWYGHPADATRRNADPRVAHTIARCFFNERTRTLRVPGTLNDHFGDPCFGVVKVLEVTVCVTGASSPVRVRFEEHTGGEIRLDDPDSVRRFAVHATDASHDAQNMELHCELAREKRASAALHETVSAQASELAELRLRLRRAKAD